MKAVLLSVHVVAAIVLIGPITVAASVFPRYVRLAATRTVGATTAGGGDWAVATAMHRISRGYAVPALAVPVFGIGVGSAMGVLTQSWVLVSAGLTVAAGLLLAVAIIPAQRRILARSAVPVGEAATASADKVSVELRRLAMFTGVFSLIWVVVVVLMILRPGSTTGVWPR